MSSTSVVIPNWNGKDSLGSCLEALKSQNQPAQIIVVDNGSSDKSVEFLEKNYPEIIVVRHRENRGFAGGVNGGIKKAMELGANYVALINNDAVAEPSWLKHLIAHLDSNPKTGIATSKIIGSKNHRLDSTGEMYTIWGLPYPRGRGETDIHEYDTEPWIFGASGGATIYRIKMLEKIGLFDEDFFAYYEDVDLSFRAQLAGWKVAYIPAATVYHEIGVTSNQVKDFVTYQTLKNLPMLMWKNVPWALMPKIWPRLAFAYLGICTQALLRGQFSAFFKGTLAGTVLLPKKWLQRYGIQKSRKVSASYINSIITHDLPPNAHKLKALRSGWWKLTGRAE